MKVAHTKVEDCNTQYHFDASGKEYFGCINRTTNFLIKKFVLRLIV